MEQRESVREAKGVVREAARGCARKRPYEGEAAKGEAGAEAAGEPEPLASGLEKGQTAALQHWARVRGE